MGKKPYIATYAIIIIITFGVYSNSLKNEFIDYWDDNTYITGNELIKTLNLHNLKSIFSSFFSTDYYPLNLLSYAIDYHFWQLNPIGYHITNTLLHSLNAILIFLIIKTITARMPVAAIATVIFIIHPINVESVVWVSQRKTVLSSLFFLISFYLYIKCQQGKRYCYLASIVIYIFAILSKSSVVMFPFILLLFDLCFNRRRLSANMLDKIPFLFISIMASIITIITFERSPAFEFYQQGLYWRILGMLSIFSAYVGKVFIPIGLNNNYVNYIPTSIFVWRTIISILFLSIIAFLAYRCLKRDRIIFFCILWFFINLIPVSNIIPIPHWMADRYLYYSSFAFSWFIATLFEKAFQGSASYAIFSRLEKIGCPLLMMAILIFYVSLTIIRNRDWQDSITLWEDCVRKDPNGALAHTYLGASYMKKGLRDKALIEFKTALQLNPRRANALANLAYMDIERGLLDDAIKKIRLALLYEGNNYEAHNALGIFYMSKGRYHRAVVEFQRALELQPETIADFLLIYNNLGVAYHKKGLQQDAIFVFNKALNIYPDDYEGNLNLATIYAFYLNDKKNAIHYLNKIKTLQPMSLHIGQIEARIAEIAE